MKEQSDVDRAAGCGVYLKTEKPHTHVNEQGMLVKCYHKSVTEVRRVGFWVGTFIAFPLEHFIYDNVWPFTLIKHWLGL